MNRIRWTGDKYIDDIEKRIYAYNQEDLQLGYLEYVRVGRFMHWCWFQNEHVQMSPGCLQEVRDMQKLALKKYQKKKEHVLGSKNVY